MSGSGDAPSDRLRERADQSRLKLWVLLEADRWLVTGILVAAVFCVLVGAGYLYPTTENAIRTSDSVDTLFQGFLTATITGVTLVLTLNQLVLSQELGAVKDQRERMEGAMEFREDVADVIEAAVSPSRPAQFLRALVQVSGERAEDLREAVSDAGDGDLQAEIADLTDSLVGNADSVASGLDDARFGEFDVISSALNFNYSWKIFTARRIHEQYGEDLDEEGTEALERLIEVLRLFGPAREHFKTLYFQWELINLSRQILAAAIPALLVSAVMIIFFNDATYSVTVFGIETLALVMALAATVAVVPFLILLAYVMRIATVTQHTLSIGPFILRETDDVTEVEWNRDG
ncbi:hypothetical protein I7X12_18145 [Halosimplex litoreum]|uniref:Uncharacterized protein n=1 Tax=Halosimplex litoreum TaxID=1198301 RepID=A0A7T3FXT9_9EURY|nr:hypothetical protein [Halosimplex litoreum]QPV62626.1 hypothetical protein I7X12_18145 [Halosimplex litoreum]